MMLEYGISRISSDGSLGFDEGGHGVEVSRATSYAGVGCFTRAFQLSTDLILSLSLCVCVCGITFFRYAGACRWSSH